MRKLICVWLFLLLAASVVFAAKIPPPFDKVKELAMTVQPDKDGDYICNGSFIENGEEVKYGFCWIVNENLIGVWRSGYGALAYHTKEDKFYVIYYGRMMEIEREKAIEAAFKIFRELVKRGLI